MAETFTIYLIFLAFEPSLEYNDNKTRKMNNATTENSRTTKNFRVKTDKNKC